MESFSSKSAFSGWDSAALEAYVRCGLVGDRPVELACDPVLEADVYRGSNTHERSVSAALASVSGLWLADGRLGGREPRHRYSRR